MSPTKYIAILSIDLKYGLMTWFAYPVLTARLRRVEYFVMRLAFAPIELLVAAPRTASAMEIPAVEDEKRIRLGVRPTQTYSLAASGHVWE